MTDLEYTKIDTLYDRDGGHFVNVSKLRRPEFGNIKRWSITEKIHGRNTRVTLFDNGEVVYGGKTDDAEIPTELLEYLRETFTQEKMKMVFWLPDKPIPKSATIYGEGYGPGTVPGSGIYRSDVSFRLFDCLVKSEDENWWLERSNLEDIAGKLGIKCVPILGFIDFLPVNSREIENIFLVNTKKLVATEESGKVGGKPEGIVATTEEMLFNRKGERVMWKLKIKDFKKDKDVVITKWKRKHEGNMFGYLLVLDDGIDIVNDGDSENDCNSDNCSEDKVVGSVIVIEDIGNGDITVETECEKIGYKATQECVEKRFLEITVSNMKNFIKEEFEKIDKNKKRF
jgi:hypothetical protein